jgi:predicted DNA-binding transcriptional regulator AlpA
MTKPESNRAGLFDLAEPLLDITGLCELLRVRPATVYGWRYRNQGPPVIVVGTNKLRWRREDVVTWLERNSPDTAKPLGDDAPPRQAGVARKTPRNHNSARTRNRRATTERKLS